MSPEDSLFSIAEISIGLAGFSGLVAAFVQHSGQPWRADQKARIVILIALSFGMIVSSLAPYALSGVSTSPAVVFGAPMIVFSVLTISLLVHWIVISRKFGFTLQFPYLSIPVLIGAVCFASGFVAAEWARLDLALLADHSRVWVSNGIDVWRNRVHGASSVRLAVNYDSGVPQRSPKRARSTSGSFAAPSET